MNELEQLIEKRAHLSKMAMNPALAATLLAGGGGALAGGALTASGPENERESRSERRRRILRNALVSGAAGAGVVGAGAFGANQLMNALPERQSAAFSRLGRLALFGGAGAAGAGAGHVWERGVRADAAQEAVTRMREAYSRTKFSRRKGQIHPWFMSKHLESLDRSGVKQVLNNLKNDRTQYFGRPGKLGVLGQKGQELIARLGLEPTGKTRMERYVDPVFRAFRSPSQALKDLAAHGDKVGDNISKSLNSKGEAARKMKAVLEKHKKLRSAVGVTSSTGSGLKAIANRHPRAAGAAAVGALTIPAGRLVRNAGGNIFAYGD